MTPTLACSAAKRLPTELRIGLAGSRGPHAAPFHSPQRRRLHAPAATNFQQAISGLFRGIALGTGPNLVRTKTRMIPPGTNPSRWALGGVVGGVARGVVPSEFPLPCGIGGMLTGRNRRVSGDARR